MIVVEHGRVHNFFFFRWRRKRHRDKDWGAGGVRETGGWACWVVKRGVEETESLGNMEQGHAVPAVGRRTES